ncbi:MAG: hypothetical protein LBD62_01845 [Candidatus Margulisbacteria bacterium]|jgi:hypothetical protein|nr:hypothetical protein [Candidatus Margulisiibacteriota bacterium]
MRKFHQAPAKLFFLTLCSFLSAGIWQDFNGRFEARVPPGYPPVDITSVSDFTPLVGQAVKFTARQANGAAVIVIEGRSNLEEVDTLTFFCRTDTSCEMEIALADSRSITAFENIKNYLPDQALTRQWQRAEIPLAGREINMHDLRKIYVQLLPAEDAEPVLYLDDITLEKAEKIRPNYQVVYNFDNDQQSIFAALPTLNTRNAYLTLAVESQNHYGAQGKSLQCSFETRENPAEIFFPMTPYPKKNTNLTLTKTSLALRSEYPLTLTLVPETSAEHKKIQFGEARRVRQYQITLREPAWQKLTLPLLNGADYYGLRIIIPAQTSGVFYLDDLSLN